MADFDQIQSVWFETFNTVNGPTVRMISFEHDEVTGARSVYDIMEADHAAGIAWLAQVAAEYSTLSDTEVEYFLQGRTDVVGGGLYKRTLAEADTGRARKLQSKLVNAVNAMIEELY